MDEEKLKEDDWMKEISRTIGEQIDQDDNKDNPIESERDYNIDSVPEEKKNKEEELKTNNEHKTSKVGVPVVDKDTTVEKASVEDVEIKNEKPEEEKEENQAEQKAEEIPEQEKALAEDVEEEKETEHNEEADSEDEIPTIQFDEETLLGEEAGALENYLENAQTEKKKKKWPWWKKLLAVFCILCAIIGVAATFIWFSLGNINRERPEDIKKQETDLTPSELAAQQATLKPQQFNSEIEQKVVNILLIGEEAIFDGSHNGRSDSMMVATLNTVEKTIKLTSLMRDMYVTIPGYRNSKLNSAYNKGGGVLLAETIEQNFGIEIDGYVRVNFEAFEKIVNELGGVDIELTEKEAHYLNTTNYISKKKYRNVTEGKNKLNGNQALGYCRVRYQGASNGELNDFGRTYRQRTVIKAIFDKYKHQNVVNMVSIASDLLKYVTSNMSKTEMLTYLTTAASFGKLELETFRIPCDNTYHDERMDGPGWVLVVDFDKNKRELRKFIYAGIPDGDIEVKSGDTEDDRYFSYLWTD